MITGGPELVWQFFALLSGMAGVFIALPMLVYQCFKMAALGWNRGRQMSEQSKNREE